MVLQLPLKQNKNPFPDWKRVKYYAEIYTKYIAQYPLPVCRRSNGDLTMGSSSDLGSSLLLPSQKFSSDIIEVAPLTAAGPYRILPISLLSLAAPLVQICYFKQRLSL